MPFSFLHAADLHLDTPFTSVSGYPERVGAALREASLEAWDALIQTAINRQVARLFLHLATFSSEVTARVSLLFTAQ